MASFVIFCRVLLLVLNAAAILHPLRRRGLLRDDAAILMALGASAIFHAIAAGPNDDTVATSALAGFFMWVGGVAMLLLKLTPGLFPGAAAHARFAAQLVQGAAGAVF